MKIITYLLLALLGILLALFMAWIIGVFEGTKYDYPPVEKTNLAPVYTYPTDGKG